MLGIGPHQVFVDANVLYSRTLRDWLGLLYTIPENPPFEVCWSEDVLAEAIYRLRRDHPEWSGGQITSVRDRIAGTFEAGRVEDFRIDTAWKGSDKDDGHVHAAAVACGADILLTCDKRFPTDDLPYSVYSPDDFLVLVDDSAPWLITQAALQEVDYWLRRGQEPHLPHMLREAGCPDFAERVRQRLNDAPSLRLPGPWDPAK